MIAPIVLISILLIVIMTAVYMCGHEEGYRSGQIDAINGKQVYVLKTQLNNERKWVHYLKK